MRYLTFIGTVVCALVLTAAAAPVAGRGQTPTAATPAAATPTLTGPQATALLVATTAAPRPVRGSDGMEHLDYDLIVTNAFVSPVTLTSVEVLAPDGQTLLRLAGDPLVQATQPMLGSTATTAIPASATVAVVVDVAVPPDQVPARLTHRIAYALSDSPANAIIGSLTIDGPELTVDARPPATIAPPLSGPGWLAVHGCCAAWSTHRWVRLVDSGAHIVKPEMFHIDWVRLQDDRFFHGDSSRNDAWFGFGAEVRSAADGTVIAARDGVPEETPNQPPTTVKQPLDYYGNYVVVAIEPDVWALYAHLQTGSVRVREGDRVTTGQPIALLGNTGNSSAPHLHFGLIDGPDPVIANAIPFVIDQYTLTGTADPESLGNALSDPSGPALKVDGTPQAQTATDPLALAVADFP